MKRNLITIKTATLMLCTVLISILAVQCTKEGKNASSLNRAFASSNIDSTIFSPFYDTTVLNVATTKAINDSIVTTGIQSIIKANCGACHNNNVKPNLVTFNDIKSLVVPGNPEGSKLWQLINTNDLNRAMPPVTTAKEVSTEDKISIYNWIKNGANETPVLADYRPAAVRLITGGCTAVCHNENVAIGAWARTYKDFGRDLTAQDTITGSAHNNIGKASVMINDTLMARMWNTYRDSIIKYYTDINANATFNVKKTLGAGLGPLNNYNDLLFDIIYPKGIRSKKTDFVNLADSATASSFVLTRIDGSISFVKPAPSNAATSNGSMATGDGSLSPSEIAIIKGWYFQDPNVPDIWKYGKSNQGIFRDKGGNMIIKKTN